MYNNNNAPPIPFRPGQGNPMGHQTHASNFNNHGNIPPIINNMGLINNKNSSNITGMGGIMLHGVSKNMQNAYVDHINTLEPLITNELKNSKFRGSITNMTKLNNPSKREFALLVETALNVQGRELPVSLYPKTCLTH